MAKKVTDLRTPPLGFFLDWPGDLRTSVRRQSVIGRTQTRHAIGGHFVLAIFAPLSS